MWTANAGAPSTNARAYLYVYLPDVRPRTSPATFDAFVAGLSSIPAYKAKIEEAAANDFESKYPMLFITDLLARPEQVEQLFTALDGLLAGEAK